MNTLDVVCVVLVGVLGLWAAIATGVAFAKDLLINQADDLVARLLLRVDSLEDRLQSSSLGEYHAARQVAMPATPAAAGVIYRYDDTGLIRDIAPPEDDE